MRIIAKFSKGKEVRFTSHLDVQRLFQRAFRRAQIPVAYSEGFTPPSILSVATALSRSEDWCDRGGAAGRGCVGGKGRA